MPPIIVLTSPHFIPHEIEGIIALFEEGLTCLHLRKPNASYLELSQFISKIPQIFHSKIVLHSHHELVNLFDLKGIHFTSLHKTPVFVANKKLTYSQSVHSFEEIWALDERIDYVFLSPIFDSISKENYLSNFSKAEIKSFFAKYTGKSQVFALGGINSQNVTYCFEMGFHGVAVLGVLWQNYIENPSIPQLCSNFRLLN